MAIQTCFFDMGNVLVYFSHRKMCENVAHVCDVSIEKTKSLLIDSGLQNQIECGHITEEEFHAEFERRFEKKIDFAALKHAAADIFHLNESIVPLLDELKALGTRLVLLSNTSVTHLRYIQQEFDVLDNFDAFTTSFEAGAQKPDSPIYEDALEKAGCSPEECFYTDDIESYVIKARGFGIHAEIYTDTQLTRQALRALDVPVLLDTSSRVDS